MRLESQRCAPFFYEVRSADAEALTPSFSIRQVRIQNIPPLWVGSRGKAIRRRRPIGLGRKQIAPCWWPKMFMRPWMRQRARMARIPPTVAAVVGRLAYHQRRRLATGFLLHEYSE